MPHKDPSNYTIFHYVFLTTFGAIGGVIAYCMRTLEAGGKPTGVRAVVEAFASGFVGLTAMFMCNALEVDWRWSGAIVGVFGWLGAEASIMLIANRIRKHLGINIGEHNVK